MTKIDIVVGLEVVEKSLTPSTKSVIAAEFFDSAPTYFLTILASVVCLEVVDKSSTPRKW